MNSTGVCFADESVYVLESFWECISEILYHKQEYYLG